MLNAQGWYLHAGEPTENRGLLLKFISLSCHLRNGLRSLFSNEASSRQFPRLYIYIPNDAGRSCRLTVSVYVRWA